MGGAGELDSKKHQLSCPYIKISVLAWRTQRRGAQNVLAVAAVYEFSQSTMW